MLDENMLTRYQNLIVKYLEAEYKMSADKVIQMLHKRNRFSDIAETIGCSRMTLRAVCKGLGIDDSDTKVIIHRVPSFLNATDFFRKFKNVEDAVVECRDKLRLSVEETAEKLGIGRSSVVRHTPEYLKYTFNFSKKGLDKKRISGTAPSADHPWRK